MKRLFLIRHGESIQNQQDLLSGVSDVPLSQTGKEQCSRLRAFFSRFPVEAVFASPLSRAIESARIVFPQHEIVIAEGLIEFDYGDYEGMPRTHEDEVMRRWHSAPADAVFPGGKSVKEHALQVYNEILSIAQKTPAHNIACFSHRTTIRLIVAQVLGLDLNKFRLLPCSNCSVTTLLFTEEDGLQLQSLNVELEFLVRARFD